jgi:hypothetical protein
MWEHRLVWPTDKPSWWDAAWSRGVDLLRRRGRAPEERPDVYLVVGDRADIGLKLRGGTEKDFDAKVRYLQQHGWELWEKIPYFTWNDLEAARFAAMIGARAPSDGVPSNVTPTDGATALLQAVRFATVPIEVKKVRLQASAPDLLPAEVGTLSALDQLAELVEIHLPERPSPVLSMCVEGAQPLADETRGVPGAIYCGYPELLLRHLKGTL